MHALVTRRGASLVFPLVLLLAAGGLAACKHESEADNAPAAAQGTADTAPAVAQVTADSAPGGVVEVKLEDANPLGPEDVGHVIYAAGTVVGKVLPAGFFLKTEGNQVIFVATPPGLDVPVGHTLRAVGPLRASTAAIFEGWKTDALAGVVEAQWQLVITYYIEATAVAVAVA